MESHLEARLWNDVFDHVEGALGLDPGTIRATVLIETIPAAFEMHEILWELRPHAAGLNAGRWDYLFSIIKNFRDAGPQFVLPDRAAVTMTAPFMRAYTELLVSTCHARGAMAMGGMAAFIPSRRDPEVNAVALAKVRDDKEREARDGFDGSWVAHPDLVPVCAEVFDRVLGDRPNQLDRRRDEVSVSADQLLDVAATPGAVTQAGLRLNISIAVRYIASWLAGNGAAALDNLMEDAATAEISRSQIWQWIRNGTTLDTGEVVTADLVRRILDEEMAVLGPEYEPARAALRAGRPGRRLRGLPHPARVRAHRLMLNESVLAELNERLAPVDAALRRNYPGEPFSRRQPVHTVYVPADRYEAGLPAAYGQMALAAVDAHGPLPFADAISERVLAKLRAEPIEDLRIDFEDGYGSAPDDEEDAAAEAAGGGGTRRGPAPRSSGCGARAWRRRPGAGPCARSTCSSPALGPPPPGFVITLPKVSAVEQVEAMVVLCVRLEHAHGLAVGLAAVRGPDRDPAGRDRGRRRGHRRPHGARRGRAGASACTTARTTTRPPSASRRSTRAWSTRRPTSPRRSCRSRRPAPACGCPTGRPTSCRSGPPRTSARRGSCTPGWCGARWSAASTRAGTCTRPSCRRGSGRPTRSSAAGRRRSCPGCATTWAAPGGR